MGQWIAERERAGEISVNANAEQSGYKIWVWISGDLARSETGDVEKVHPNLSLESASIEDSKWRDLIDQIGSTCRRIFPAM